jgi:hypothetical protein
VNEVIRDSRLVIREDLVGFSYESPITSHESPSVGRSA